jgi:hypothetical protein
VIFDDETYSAGAALGLSAFPYFVFADADGKVVQRATGELEMATVQAIAESIAP